VDPEEFHMLQRFDFGIVSVLATATVGAATLTIPSARPRLWLGNAARA